MAIEAKNKKGRRHIAAALTNIENPASAARRLHAAILPIHVRRSS
ncbi:hypothetical protein ACFQ3P_39745 [Paraburkholderia sabiae]|uniref:Transposase n=1 Tax=Paraburkholderia sabiae TaxID=273251 RepID=A0ABU9QQT7_9BURK|nr:hypothetical protein [Paraburkholderia sabiae]WJZ74869.1 hypothetical protein QEN71_03375 [Paraburkholderia sabiae]